MLKEKFEIGKRVLLHSSASDEWLSATITHRRTCYSITKAILGYAYIVKRDGGEYGDNVHHRFEIKVGEEIEEYLKKQVKHDTEDRGDKVDRKELLKKLQAIDKKIFSEYHALIITRKILARTTTIGAITDYITTLIDKRHVLLESIMNDISHVTNSATPNDEPFNETDLANWEKHLAQYSEWSED